MHRRLRTILQCCLPLALVILQGLSALANPSVIYREGWENGIGDWFPSSGVWQAGVPTQTTAHEGDACAATLLSSNYPYATNSRLTSPLITLPSPEEGIISLGFWHWFNNSRTDGVDYGEVQIWTEATNWQTVSRQFVGYSAIWTPYYADLSAYAGQTIRIGFRFQDVDGTGVGHSEAPGWFIDDIKVFTGNFDAPISPVTFERDHECEFDWSGWYSDQGVWEIGAPTYGVAAPYSGGRCAGTVMDNTYPFAADSRLISPPITLQSSPLDGKLWLTFKQWCGMSWTDGVDYGTVEILDGATWVQLGATISPSWSTWSECVLDISAYSGRTVRLGFRLRDVDGTGVGHYEGAGWFVDEVAISEGRLLFDNPTDCENDAPGWTSEDGVWQLGAPAVTGPSAAHSGTKCWGTNQSGNYPFSADDRLWSPPVALPAAPEASLQLRFYHWYSFSNTDGTDRGAVYLLPESGPAVQVGGDFVNTSGGIWTQYIIDLLPYAGQTVRFYFLIDDNDGTGVGHYESSGWYIDDIEIVGMDHSSPIAPYFANERINAGPAEVSWVHNAAGIANVIVYGSPVEGFRPSIGSRLAVLPGNVYSYVDEAHVGWPGLYYRVSVVDLLGHESFARMANPVSAVPGDQGVPDAERVALREPFPNPFNPRTTIGYDLPEAGEVTVAVYDLRGRLVRSLWRGRLDAGYHQVVWDGRNEQGGDTSTGIYLVRLRTASGIVRSQKMTLSK